MIDVKNGYVYVYICESMCGGLRGTETSILDAYVCGLRGHMTSVLATPCLWRLRGTNMFVLTTPFGLRGYRVYYFTSYVWRAIYIYPYEENTGCKE